MPGTPTDTCVDLRRWAPCGRSHGAPLLADPLVLSVVLAELRSLVVCFGAPLHNRHILRSEKLHHFE